MSYATRSTICLNISDPNSRNKSGFRCHQAGSSKKTQSDKKQTTATSNVCTVAANLIVLLPNERKRARWRPKRCLLARMSAQKKKVKAAATKQQQQQQQTVNVTGVQRKRRCRRRDVVWSFELNWSWLELGQKGGQAVAGTFSCAANVVRFTRASLSLSLYYIYISIVSRRCLLLCRSLFVNSWDS